VAKFSGQATVEIGLLPLSDEEHAQRSQTFTFVQTSDIHIAEAEDVMARAVAAHEMRKQ
jgi:hypothetical protein